tara:strand:+ start:4265 stop:9172 length:4908 start_codon:yes stop_codon:yes gene_type:complete
MATDQSIITDLSKPNVFEENPKFPASDIRTFQPDGTFIPRGVNPSDALEFVTDSLGLEETFPETFNAAVTETGIGNLKVDPLKTTPAFSYADVVSEKELNKIEGAWTGEVNEAGEAIINPLEGSYEDKIKILNQINPQALYFKDKGKKAISVDEMLGFWNSTRIDNLRIKEMKAEQTQTGVTEALGLLAPDDVVQVDKATYSIGDLTGSSVPGGDVVDKVRGGEGGPSRATKAKVAEKYFRSLTDAQGNKLSNKDIVGLLNREILGRGQADTGVVGSLQKVYDLAGYGREFATIRNVSGKAMTLLEDVPRSIVDLLTVTGFGVAGEYGYKAFKVVADGLGFPVDPIDKNRPDSVYTPQTRDAARTFLGDDAMRKYQKDLAQNGILVSKELTGKIFDYNFDSIERIFTIAPAILADVKIFLAGTTRKAGILQEKMGKFKTDNPGLANNPEEFTKAFIESELNKSSFNIFRQGSVLPKKLREHIISERLKKGVDIVDATKPLSQRIPVVQANKRLEKTTKDLNNYIEKDSLAAYRVATGGDQKYKELSAKVLRAKVEKTLVETTSGTPAWLSQTYKDAAVFTAAAGVAGQTMQYHGQDPKIGYLLGMGSVMTYQVSHGIKNTFFTKDNFIKIINPEKRNDFILYLNRLEMNAGGFKNTDEIREALKNPALENIPKNLQGLAIELTSKMIRVDDNFANDVAANAGEYYQYKKDLEALGIDPKLITDGLGSISQVSFFNTLEDSFLANIDYSDVFNADTLKIFKSIQDQRQALQQNTSLALQRLLNIEGVDKNNPALIRMVAGLESVAAQNQKNFNLVESLAAQVKQKKISLLQDIVTGVVDPDDMKAINAGYGSVNSFYRSITNDLTQDLRLAKDINAAKKYKNQLLQVESIALDVINNNLTTLEKQTTATLANIPGIRAGSTPTSTAILTGSPNTVLANLNKYGAEDSSLAKIILFSRDTKKAQARAPFIEFDKQYVGYQTDATDLAFDFIEKLRAGELGGTRKLVKETMAGGDKNIIYTTFNDSAENWLKKMEFDDADITSFKDEMIEEGFDADNIEAIDILMWLRSGNGGEFKDQIAIGLSMNQTVDLLDGMAKGAAKYQGERGSIDYARFRDQVETLFDNVIDPNGQVLQDGSQILTSLRTMKQNYMGQYLVFRNKDTLLGKWANPKNADDDTKDTPGGKVWSTSNKPNTWLTVDSLFQDSSAATIKIDNFNEALVGAIGKYTAKFDANGKIISGSTSRIIDGNGPYAGSLEKIALVKYHRGIEQLARKNLSLEKFNTQREILETNLTNAFKYNRNDPKSASAFNRADAYSSLSLDSRALENKDIAEKTARIFKEIDTKANKQQAAITVYLKKRKGNMATINNLVGGLKTNESTFNTLFVSANGQQSISGLKRAMTTPTRGGNKATMSGQEFDDAMKEIVGVYTQSLIIKPRGDFIIKTYKNADGSITTQKIDRVDTDTEALNDLLNNDITVANLKAANVISDKQLKDLKVINRLLIKQKSKDQADVSFRGRPTGMSVESYISRFYSINRGVVSARYVGTEAIVQVFRKNKHRLLEQMITNPKVAEAMAELMSTPSDLSETRIRAIDALLMATAVQVQAQQNQLSDDQKARAMMPTMMSIEESLNQRNKVKRIQ